MSSSIQYLNYYGNFTTHHIDIVPSYLRAALSYDPETNKRILLQTLLYSSILLINIYMSNTTISSRLLEWFQPTLLATFHHMLKWRWITPVQKIQHFLNHNTCSTTACSSGPVLCVCSPPHWNTTPIHLDRNIIDTHMWSVRIWYWTYNLCLFAPPSH